MKTVIKVCKGKTKETTKKQEVEQQRSRVARFLLADIHNYYYQFIQGVSSSSTFEIESHTKIYSYNDPSQCLHEPIQRMYIITN